MLQWPEDVLSLQMSLQSWTLNIMIAAVQSHLKVKIRKSLKHQFFMHGDEGFVLDKQNVFGFVLFIRCSGSYRYRYRMKS